MHRVGIIGARGFTGGELLRLLLNHPEFKVTYVTSESSEGEQVASVFPGLSGQIDLLFEAYDPQRALDAADLFFFALPDGEAMKRVGPLLSAGARVVDLSGDFRIKNPQVYRRWYGRDHAAPELLPGAAYGLTETYPEVAQARLVANCGCYAISSLLALTPIFDRGSGLNPDPQSVIVDAKSGVSGAGGRAAMDPSMSFPAVHDNFRAYSPTGHRHIGEIEQSLMRVQPEDVVISFTPHLLPVTRGILSTMYVNLADNVDEEDLAEMYREFYAGAPFVRVLRDRLPELRHVVGSNLCEIAFRWDERTGRLTLFSAIDNLIKGAAGSAIQNMNLMLDLPQQTGLPLVAPGP